MGVKFTPEQKETIDLRDCNILVSAAAGSGKTAVLTERIVDIVCDEKHPVDVDRLLVVTFTSAAAAEMRERVAGMVPARPPTRSRSARSTRSARASCGATSRSQAITIRITASLTKATRSASSNRRPPNSDSARTRSRRRKSRRSSAAARTGWSSPPT